MRTGVPRIIEVLELISSQPNGVTVSELAQLMKINKASASRLLKSYLETGIVERDLVQRYRPGMLLFSFGCSALHQFRPAEVARSIIYAASKEKGVNLYTATARGEMVYNIEQVGPGIPVTLLLGTAIPIHASGPGKAILAFSPPDVIEQFLDSGPYRRFTEHTITTREEMEKEFEGIRGRGFSINRGEYITAAVGLAAPVFDFTGKPVCTVGNTCAQDELTDEYIRRIGPIILEVAAQVSTALGHTPVGRTVG